MLNCDLNCDSLLLHSSTLFYNQFWVTLVIMSFSQSGDVQQFLKNDQTCTFVNTVYLSGEATWPQLTNELGPLDDNLDSWLSHRWGYPRSGHHGHNSLPQCHKAYSQSSIQHSSCHLHRNHDSNLEIRWNFNTLTIRNAAIWIHVWVGKHCPTVSISTNHICEKKNLQHLLTWQHYWPPEHSESPQQWPPHTGQPPTLSRQQ